MSAIGAEKILFEMAAPDRAQPILEALSVTVPGTEGVFTVLPGHAALLSLVGVGVVEVRTTAGKTEVFFVNGGLAEVLDDKVTILSPVVEHGEEINIQRATEAKERAQKRLTGRADADVARAEYALRRALARLQATAHLHGTDDHR